MGTLSAILKQAGKNIKKAGAAGDWVEAGVKGALAVGTVGGAAEWSQGGSFTEGFKDASFEGAALGLGARAVKVGAYGKGWQNKSMSKSVKTLRQNGRNAAIADSMFTNSKKVNAGIASTSKSVKHSDLFKDNFEIPKTTRRTRPNGNYTGGWSNKKRHTVNKQMPSASDVENIKTWDEVKYDNYIDNKAKNSGF